LAGDQGQAQSRRQVLAMRQTDRGMYMPEHQAREPHMTDKEVYLGDGLYASFDGWMIKLRAPRDGIDHEVYLEDSVLKNFMDFAKDIYKDRS
jgi:hypothetical protein